MSALTIGGSAVKPLAPHGLQLLSAFERVRMGLSGTTTPTTHHSNTSLLVCVSFGIFPATTQKEPRAKSGKGVCVFKLFGNATMPC